MKIALYVPAWPPGATPNGIVTYAAHLVPALRQLGHEVFILTPNKTGDADPGTIDLADFEPRRTLLRRIANRLLPHLLSFKSYTSALKSAVTHLVSQKGVEVVEIEESFGWSAEISKLNLIPVVVRLHGPWFLNGRFESQGNVHADRSRTATERQGIERATFVTSPSAEVLRSVKAHYGIALPDSCVLPNPIPSANEAEIWKLEACRKGSLLFVGRFDARKGGELVLKSFIELAPHYPDVTLTFVGPDLGVTAPDGELLSFDKFCQRYVAPEYRRRIDFRGHMMPGDIAPLRMSHFLTLIASQYEIAPYSVLEAMARGCPIVATSVGGIPEQINDGMNGLLVPTQDVGAMAAACRRLLDDPALASRLARQAWMDCRAIYSPATLAEQTLAVYRDAVKKFAVAHAR